MTSFECRAWLHTTALAGVLVGALGGCDPGGGRTDSASGWTSLTDSAFAESTAVASRLDSAWLDSFAPPAQVLALPDSIRDFEMAGPSSVAIGRSASCLIAVTDFYETSVHFFGSPSRYEGSVFLGGHRRGALSGIGHAAIGADGVTYLNELGRRRLVALDRTRDRVRVFQSAAVTTSMPRVVTLEPVSRNRIIENWMTPSIPLASGTWAQQGLPLLRVIDSLGNYLSGLWRIAGRPGHLLTHELNQGFLARQGDTLWFAYGVSGQIVHGVLDTTRTPWSLTDTSRIILPRLYAPLPPEWFWTESDSIGALTVDGQVSGMAVTDGGLLILGQTISYPPRDLEGSIHQPTSAVVIYDRGGLPLRGWRSGGRIRGLAAGSGILAVIVDSGGGTDVRIHQLSDVLPGGSAPGPCTEET